MKHCTLCNEKFDDSVSFCPKDGEVLEEDSGSLVGKALDGQYQIEALLGKGGMGAVYRARHVLLGDRVAIKVLPPEMRSNTEWLRRFQREGQAARRFRHPNAVTVYDLRTSSDGTIYLVMEYVEGNTLDVELRKRGTFSPAEAVAVLRPIMSVLNAAHAMGVVHRDLKPENIMIGKATTGGEPMVKLLDLGIAKLREVAGAEKTGSTNLTVAGQMLGTPYYMSPEQWGELPHDGNSEIDGRADIYSLGCVLYEIIAAKRPFNGLTLAELRRQHVSITPEPLHQAAANVPESFSRVIARSMAKDRDDRQSTAGEVEQELTTALSAEGISSTPVAFGSTIRILWRRFQWGGDVASPDRGDHGHGDGSGRVGNSQPGCDDADRDRATEGPRQSHYRERDCDAAATDTRESFAAAGCHGRSAAEKSSALLIAGVGLVVLLLIAGVGGFFVMSTMMKKSDANTAKTETPANSSAADVAAGHEAARYWLQLNSEADSVRAGEALSLTSGQQFKLHFSPSENGYLYILGPGNNNALTTFLTDKPDKDFGVSSNEIKSGEDFSFPADSSKEESWMNLDKNPGTEEFTMIFSSSKLTTPAFLNEAALHELTGSEQKELDDLVNQSKANLLGTEVIKTGSSPFVSVKVPQTTAEGAPVVFKIRIDHK
jgi:serine/threonine-protein kinase